MPFNDPDVARFRFESDPLHPETFRVLNFEGEEHVSRLFEFTVNLLSDDPDLDLAQVVNQAASLTLMRGPDPAPVHGMVRDFRQGGRRADLYDYRAVLVPRVWVLSLTYQSRIFQHETVEEIVTKVLEEHGFAADKDFRFDLAPGYLPREYCVQYRERDLDFVFRLLEHEGIHFFFEHDAEDVLVMTDDTAQNPRLVGEDMLPYNPGAGLSTESEAVGAFVCREQVVTGKVVLKDYNYRTPTTDLQAESQINGEMPGMYYEYGDHYPDAGEGSRLAQVRNEEIECARRVMFGESNCPGLRSGHVFSLEAHFRDNLNAEYVITSVLHTGTQMASYLGDDASSDTGANGAPPYSNTFTCIPAEMVYRPPRRTPTPRIPGIMSSRTETGGGDYAYLDDEGRYRVKMFFDLGDKTDGEATRPIRMNQPYSGPGYGIHFPNHADTELVWACVDGNPDRPVALGTVPNPTQTSPSTSANKPQNVIRTWGQNELTFDDTGGSENILMIATKDHTVQVANDESFSVGHDQSTSVGNDQTNEIGNDQSTTVGNDQTIDVGNNRTKTVGADQSETVGSNKTIDVGANHTESIGSNMSVSVGSNLTETVALNYAETVGVAMELTVGAALATSVGASSSETVGVDKSVTVGGSASLTVGSDHSETAGGNVSVQAGEKLSITAGDDVSLNGGKTAEIVIADELLLSCGDASISLKKDGTVVIKGKDITIDGSGKINVKASGDVIIKGKKVAIN